MQRSYDVVLYGATGFTGQRAARYLATHPQRAGLRFALAGRNRGKLESLRDSLPSPQDIGVVVADAHDRAALQSLAASARVVASTAGPFALYGADLVAACVENQTDYVDITGETPWVRGLIDAHHEHAAADKTRIIPMCGYDSVPSDLGAQLAVDFVRETFNDGTAAVRGYHKMRGGFNGGTMATMMYFAEHKLAGKLYDPILLNPPSAAGKDERKRMSPDQRGVERAEDVGGWTAPFFMAPVNTRVVRRSAALSADFGQPYGEDFDYNEAHLFSRRAGAWAMTLGLGATFGLQGNKLGRMILRGVIPKPGEGPSDAEIERGFFKTLLTAVSNAGERATVTISGKGDPGNHNTVIFMCESALALAFDREHLIGGESRGGVLTPATGIGLHLATRLRDAGLTIEMARAP